MGGRLSVKVPRPLFIRYKFYENSRRDFSPVDFMDESPVNPKA